MLASRPEVVVAYVSGRHRELVQQAIADYSIPVPDFVIGDVGTTIYRVGTARDWSPLHEWEQEIAGDWRGRSHADLGQALADLPDLRLQEDSKQNRFKLSYYLPLEADVDALTRKIRKRLDCESVRASLIASIDEPAGVGLLDVLPERATKFHAIEFLMRQIAFGLDNTVFCGDSGNDLEVLASPIAAVLVGNASSRVRETARRNAAARGLLEALYFAHGDFLGMNGNYAAGMLEGIAHFHPHVLEWLVPDAQ